MAASTEWMQHAACRDEDPALFIGPLDETPEHQRGREAAARAVCARCPARVPCLAFRLVTDSRQDDGMIWGGLDSAERAVMRRRQVRREAERKRTGRAA